MMRWLIAVFPAVFCLLIAALPAQAEQNEAKWVWFDAGNPAEEAPAETVWFRREVRGQEPSTGAVRIICEDQFVLWVNGERIGEGGGEKLYRFNLSGIVERGPNVIAVEATNRGGRAGLFVDGEIRGQSGRQIPFPTGPEWRTTRQRPEKDDWLKPGFDTEDWKSVKVIGPHDESPWKSIALTETYLDRYELPPGFEIQRVAEPELVGSLVNITWGNGGRLIASRERGPILSLIDTNDDGTFDQALEYSNDVTNCQGLCMVFDDLYAVGDGPQGTGLYRLPDRNGDGVADEVHHIHSYEGRMAEHGPHAVVLGPDGWLYNVLGNHAWVTADPEPTTPVRDWYEGDFLQPRFEDARGHARGIKAPGGTIWRFTPDGEQWWCEVSGFRNQYDVAFNAKGELFTFDSDMEWDVGMPWFRPVRVNHCIPGAEFGWRSGAAKWPDYYFDSLDSVVDVGRGSPTGVVFYEHRQFPEKYRGAFVVCDWSMGRIMAVHLEPDGATFGGRFESLVTGNPLNVSDIEIAPDGSLIFCTGGRNTEGGVYRVSYPGGDTTPASAETVEELLDLPQMQSAWAREIAADVKQKVGDAWQEKLLQAAHTGSESHQLRALTLLATFGPKPDWDSLVYLTKDAVAPVRAFATHLLGDVPREEAQVELPGGGTVESALVRLLSDPDAVVRRRACEAFVRSGIEAPVEPLIALLKSEDRWLRFAARLALERIPANTWKDAVVASDHPHVVTHGLLALFRLGNDVLPADEALQVEWELLSGKRGELSAEQTLDLLRVVQLTLQAGGSGPVADKIGEILLKEFPTGDDAVDTESSRILAVLQVPGAAERLVEAMETAETQSQQVHYALALRYVEEGWNLDLKRRMLVWYEGTQDWEGGHSFQPYLANIVGAGLERYAPGERRQLLESWPEYPFAAGLLVRNSRPDQISGYEEIVGEMLEETGERRQRGREQLIAQAVQALGRSETPAARELLRRLYEAYPDRREPLARAMAEKPGAEDWPHLVRTLQFADETTNQLVLGALAKLDRRPENPEEVRAVILAGLRLGEQGGLVAATLLRKWTGSQHEAGKDVQKALAHYQTWYAAQYPEAPPAELPEEDPEQSKYTFDQLVAFLEQSPEGRAGDAERGRKIFEKANCLKCHRFLDDGESIGPDLTSVRRRFQRKEIIESIVYPSLVISDQYRMVTVLTEDGLVHSGMPVPGADDGENLVLLLSDATQLEIPQQKVDEMVPSNVSVMPAGLLNDLTLDEIADLFAFLETSRFNEPVPSDPTAEAEE